ncbi:hypothetical protein D9619_009212 [Psilocybe cf. subviscida]|uniref:Uncharacterized protein n=1 Tax=Psilocybe cf. subviscida TaxID=2480587 RepID=A0A8H5BTN4_9AGAR|nr:hypothetical protein D9619_009212 [Psilocybe cf. subviscida]
MTLYALYSSGEPAPSLSMDNSQHYAALAHAHFTSPPAFANSCAPSRAPSALTASDFVARDFGAGSPAWYARTVVMTVDATAHPKAVLTPLAPSSS